MKRVLLPAIVLALLLLPAAFAGGTSAQSGEVAGGAAIKNLAGCTSASIPANDDGSSEVVPIGFPVNFFGQTYTTLFVNNNGNVTFDEQLPTYTPFSLQETTRVIIAPFFADVDTRGKGSSLVTYGSDVFGGHAAFCANWVNVGYFASHTDKINSFQLLLVDRSDLQAGDFDIIMNFNQVQWETGDASGGSNGLGGFSARAGYSNGTDTSFELPGSAVNGAFLDSSPSGLANNSRDSFIAGRYVFPVRSGGAPTGGTISGHVYSPGTVAKADALVQLCRVGGACNTTSTNLSGVYAISGLPAGTYNGSAFPPPFSDLFPDTVGPLTLGEGETLSNVDFMLRQPRPVPPGVTVAGFWTTGGGNPVLDWSEPTTISKVNCPGGTAGFEVNNEGVVIASGSMTEGPSGTYTGTVPALQPRHGPAVITITVTCPNAADNKSVEVDVYIDPSGVVQDTGGNPVSGATVTLYRSDSSSGPFEAVPDESAIMSPSNRQNPDMTNAEGAFHWDVIAGYYRVRAEKAGCNNPDNPGQAYVETAVLTIPPPAVDLDLVLDCGGGPGPSPTPTPPGPTATPVPPTPTPAPQEGDANCNRTVDSIDVAIILQFVAGLISSVGCPAAADVNDDGTINSIDAALILQYVAGLIGSL